MCLLGIVPQDILPIPSLNPAHKNEAAPSAIIQRRRRKRAGPARQRWVIFDAEMMHRIYNQRGPGQRELSLARSHAGC